MSAVAADVYLASANPHKVRELQALADARGLAMRLHSASEVGGMPTVVEDTGTFAGNARKKAAGLLERLPENCWALADDSGLCVDALDGDPGVESAYFAGPAGDDEANLHKLVEVMRGVPAGERGAHYICVLVLLGPSGEEQVFEGRCHGELAQETAGTEGFGYDPFFIPRGHDRTFGLLAPAIKQALSHRALAWEQLAQWWQGREQG